MEERLKQRLVGAAILVGLGVIFIPMVLDHSRIPEPPVRGSGIPPKPESDFDSKPIPLEELPPSLPQQSASRIPATADPEPTPSAQLPPPPPKAERKDHSPAQAPGAAWAVQLGSFDREQNARALESRLKQRGYSASVDKLVRRKKSLFRVRVGPKPSRLEAEALQRRLRREFALKGMVVRYP